MYYKVTNTKSRVYKKLLALRKKEKSIDQSNENWVREKVKLHFFEARGSSGQGFFRTKMWTGFKFRKSDKPDPKIWKEKIVEGKVFYIPNKRTKVGKEMNFVLSTIPKTTMIDLFNVLGITINDYTSIIFPFMEVHKNTILIKLDDAIVVQDKSLIEITRTEALKIESASK